MLNFDILCLTVNVTISDKFMIVILTVFYEGQNVHLRLSIL